MTSKSAKKRALKKAKAVAKATVAVARMLPQPVRAQAKTQLARAAGAIGGVVGLKSQGSALGRFAGARIFGNGDYTVVSNSLMGKGRASYSSVPVFGANGRRGVRVLHREYIKDIPSSTSTFTIQGTYALNPGLVDSFPWLASSVACGFAQWEPMGIVYEFVTLSGAISTAQNLGYVAMATNYEPGSNAFATKQAMENTEYATTGAPNCNLLHGIECAPTERPDRVMYVRNGPVPSGTGTSSADLGFFTIATGGQSSGAAVLGELWVTYDIVFWKPEAVAAYQLGMSACAFAVNAAGGAAVNLFETDSLIYGTGGLGHVNSNGFAGCGSLLTNTLSWPDACVGKTFFVMMQIYGDSTAITANTWTLAGCSAVAVGTIVGTSYNSATSWSNSGTTSAGFFDGRVISVDARTATIIWSGAVIPANNTGVRLFIYQINSSYYWPVQSAV